MMVFFTADNSVKQTYHYKWADTLSPLVLYRGDRQSGMWKEPSYKFLPHWIAMDQASMDKNVPLASFCSFLEVEKSK
jgi:hypothetical protein